VSSALCHRYCTTCDSHVRAAVAVVPQFVLGFALVELRYAVEQRLPKGS
jgi:hypothetical protein